MIWKKLISGEAKLPILRVELNGALLCEVLQSDLPCEKEPSSPLNEGENTLTFRDRHNNVVEHDLSPFSGHAHFSVRVFPNLACQADCVVTESAKFDPEALTSGNGKGIRFQPFFLPDADVPAEEFLGKGLFHRGLHFSGTVTNGATVLSCVCDECGKSFLIKSYHMGFSNMGYFYSASGKETLLVPNSVEGCPAALSEPDGVALKELEGRLPEASDGSQFAYSNSFRCRHCDAAYIDFERHPEMRQGEYYGNVHWGDDPIHWEPQ